MKKEIEMMLEYLSQLTNEEADLIEHVIKWPPEYQSAFKFAKKLFEEKDEE